MPIVDNNDGRIDEIIDTPIQNEEIIQEVSDFNTSYTEQLVSNQESVGGVPNVNVRDNKTPIVFLFGPPSSGKTMTLVRLYRYLLEQNINIKPNESFVSNDNGDYVRRCKNFHNDSMNQKAAEATKGIAFMLLDIWDNGSKKCQILESPGEKLFEPNYGKDIDFPVQYVSNIINSDNKKIYIFILEPNYMDDATRFRYKERIAEVKQMMDKKDKVIFLYNKIDKSPALTSFGEVKMKTLIKEINDDYPGLLNLFKNSNPISSLYREYDCHLVPFQTGNYSSEVNSVTNTKEKIFIAGKNKYPQTLWETIKKCL